LPRICRTFHNLLLGRKPHEKTIHIKYTPHCYDASNVFFAPVTLTCVYKVVVSIAVAMKLNKTQAKMLLWCGKRSSNKLRIRHVAASRRTCCGNSTC